ncbi:MAG: thiamine phosphate synthase [Thermodesulfovibrionales bacterium]
MRDSGLFFGGICFITDSLISEVSVADQATMVLEAGVTTVQYREKGRSRDHLYREAERLRLITKRYGARLIVNDHADIALAVDADGVHLGQDDLPLAGARRIMGRKIIGISTHDEAQAIDAEQGEADYIGFGPIFGTVTKDAGSPRGVKMLAGVRACVNVPIVAIGGITFENVAWVFDSGADAVAVASAILRSEDIYASAKRFVEKVRDLSKRQI